MNATGAPRSLTFAWDFKRVPLVLGGFCLLSLGAHIATFFLFQVVYPPQTSITAPPPPITVLDPSRPDHQALLRWADAEGPAPVASGPDILSERLLEVTYRPSYSTMRTAPLMLPETTAPAQYPPARDPVSIIRSAEPKPVAAAIPKAQRITRAVFSANLAAPETPITIAARSAESLEPAAFLIGVTDRGEIRFVIPQQSSGSPAMDAAASQALSRIKLQPTQSPITWATATIEWGADTFGSPPNPKSR
jgi:hypothetical protein